MKHLIYVIEDDENIRNLICVALENFGHRSEGFETAEEALERLGSIMKRGKEAYRELPSMFIFDWMLPGMDGMTAIGKVRELEPLKGTPVLMLTAKDRETDIVMGLDNGADDYMTKPVDEEEMILRIRALLRRAQIVNERRITIGDVCLDYDSLTVSRGNESQTLPRKEFYLLYKLLSYPGKIFTRIQLMDEIWGMESQSDDNTINVHINRLRKRFEDYPEFTIETIRGLGYKAVKNL